jgi:argininosuccinate synthase
MRRAEIRSLDSLKSLLNSDCQVLCLYSGGLDGMYLLHRLASFGVRHIIALYVDLGGDRDVADVRRRAQLLGIEVTVVCASLSRPLIARLACEISVRHNCDIIVHTSNSSQNSLRRFNGALGALGFRGMFGSPFELTSISRETKKNTLEKLGVPLAEHGQYSTDTNLWGREFEYGSMDDPEKIHVPETAYRWSQAPAAGFSRAFAITFEAGLPVALNEECLDLVSLIAKTNEVAGSFGLGRYIGLEEIEGGVKVQEIREMPAAYMLLDAYRRLETATLPAESIREKMHLEQLWVREAAEGRWFGPLREACETFILSLAQNVTGRVVYRLEANSMVVVALKVKEPLYIRNRDSFEHTASHN